MQSLETVPFCQVAKNYSEKQSWAKKNNDKKKIYRLLQRFLISWVYSSNVSEFNECLFIHNLLKSLYTLWVSFLSFLSRRYFVNPSLANACVHFAFMLWGKFWWLFCAWTLHSWIFVSSARNNTVQYTYSMLFCVQTVQSVLHWIMLNCLLHYITQDPLNLTAWMKNWRKNIWTVNSKNKSVQRLIMSFKVYSNEDVFKV